MLRSPSSPSFASSPPLPTSSSPWRCITCDEGARAGMQDARRRHRVIIGERGRLLGTLFWTATGTIRTFITGRPTDTPTFGRHSDRVESGRSGSQRLIIRSDPPSCHQRDASALVTVPCQGEHERLYYARRRARISAVGTDARGAGVAGE